LRGEVQAIIHQADLNKGNASVTIIDTATGEILVDIHGNRSMIPASNQKLYTSGAALHVLGPKFTFKTQLIQSGEDLIIVGDGDPTLGDSELLGITDWSTEREVLQRELKPWVDAVIKTGKRSFETIYVDDRIFDQNFVHPSWPADQINNWYCAQVAGINYHLNVIHFYPAPIQESRASLGRYAPSLPWLTIGNRTSSKTAKSNPSSFWVSRPPNSNVMTARGNVNATHTTPVKVALHDPSLIFGKTLANELQQHGITSNEVKRVPNNADRSTGQLLYQRITPIEQALARSNRDSHNLYAEALLKRLAASATQRPGTFDEGATVIGTAISQRLGGRQQHLSIADGSGMSRENRTTTQTLTKWLSSFRLDEPSGQSLLDSLAVPGEGTLDNRFKKVDLGNATVHAKSGYLRGVCSLSGYVIFESGRKPIVFSIIVNDIKGTVKGAKKMQERIVELLSRS